MKKRLIVIDVSNFIFRAFYAIRVLHSPEGVPVNAVHGVLSMFLKILSQHQPTHVVLAKDTSGGSFRNELYSEYKANRSAPPEDLIPQFALIKTLLEKMNFLSIENETYEADDIIGSVVTQWKKEFDEIYIASGDKDLMQFIGDNVFMLDTMKDKLYDADGVFEKMGVHPNQIVDYLSMVGDASDNIPGMKGIGAKGAAKLLDEHKTLETCIEVKDTFKGKKLTNAFENHLEDALLSKKLVQIVTDIDLENEPTKSEFQFYPTDELIEWLKSLGFKSAITKLMDIRKGAIEEERSNDEGVFNNLNTDAISKAWLPKVKIVETNEDFDEVVNLINSVSAVSLHTEYTSEDKFSREIVSLSLSFDGELSYYLPFAQVDYKNLDQDKLKIILNKTWENSEIEVLSEHWKRDFTHSLVLGFSVSCQKFDVAQAHFVLNSDGRHGLSQIVSELLFHEIKAYEKKNPFVTELSIEDASFIGGERAAAIFKISETLKEALKSNELEKVYYELDDVLIPVLAKVETNGVMINPAFFEEMEGNLAEKLESIEAEISKLYEGDKINLNSPKQVSELLFETLSLPVIKKTKTGYSTDSEVLEELVAKDLSPIPALILQYREYGKLQSTYVKALPLLINEKSKRIHSSFNQHVAATGRLSSTNPNLQNIPIRSEMGRMIRKGFIATPGKVLLGADYSQVELRLLAHFSQDAVMVKAFTEGKDIHKQTASEVLGLALEDVHSDDRSKAKAVNFGLMYGQGSFGLAKQLKISRKEAKEYITKYFERFSSVKIFLDSLKEKAEENGYSITHFGRKRFLPDIYSKNRTVKAMAERVAVNSPIQGTAADIIKVAMINIQEKIESEKLKSKMLLQVHDELIFEVPEDELEIMKTIVKDGMENVVDLSVPLTVDMGIGVSWFDLK